MTMIDNAVYVNGVRTADPEDLDETYFLLRQREGMAWIGMYRPDAEELRSVAEEFDLSHLAVEDALAGHQRAKLEHYGECLFLVLRPARYLDDVEKVDFGEIHVFAGTDYVITVRHAESPDLAKVRHRMESTPEFLALGPDAVLYGILDQVVDEYEPVAAGLENDIDEIEDDLFGADPDVSRRIYELSRQVITFQRATSPLVGILQALMAGTPERQPGADLLDHFRDVLDHAIRLNERVASFRALLQNALAVNAALVAQRQNDEMRLLTESSYAQNEEVKRISSWAAILFAPTLVASIYGMNFRDMPELDWFFGYPFALGLMVAMGFVLYLAFKHNKWI
ncbi:transporter [Pseudarthrobacter psychrotolerans]|uniref:Transporter n=1 Tax=Pseudarthrobacter psychrotolerans TaxID=2697569 RepID=A0A6P1NIB9_9MICC|nr:magnesium and cobalt transport protein CorA [Pseudarthrobacter psychrotolerans]QHK20086.1 transporter [Pseudarthrobacter psychrotolerans]